MRLLLERLVAQLPALPSGDDLAASLRGLLDELVEGLRRSVERTRSDS